MRTLSWINKRDHPAEGRGARGQLAAMDVAGNPSSVPCRRACSQDDWLKRRGGRWPDWSAAMSRSGIFTSGATEAIQAWFSGLYRGDRRAD